MRDPKINLQADRVEEVVETFARSLRSEVDAGYFKPSKFTETPAEIAARRNARRRIEREWPDKVRVLVRVDASGKERYKLRAYTEKTVAIARLTGPRVGKRQRFAIRNAIIVGRLRLIRKRGFQNIEPGGDIVTASDILTRALAKCGVVLSAATIFDIWKNAPRAAREG
jgi:hypothetical protein